MASMNKIKAFLFLTTAEGGCAKSINAAEELRRSVMSCMLWEDEFYEDGVTIAERIKNNVALVGEQEARQILYSCKFESKLRHTPLWIAICMTPYGWLKANDIFKICTRADDLTEMLSLYWKDGKKPIANQMKKGLALAFGKFDEYQLAKYDRNKPVKLRDILRITRPKPINEQQESLWKRVLTDELETPDTWEVALSAGNDKKESFERLISSNMLGDLAFLRNMRNMIKNNVSSEIIKNSFSQREWKYILPFQFITVARFAPQYKSELEIAMMKCMTGIEKIEIPVSLLIDVSGSMSASLAKDSMQTRLDVASGLAILARELFSNISIATFHESIKTIPPRRGFALRDAIGSPDGGTMMWNSIKQASQKFGRKKIVMVITDEQTSDHGTASDSNSDLLVIINVGSARNGVGYGDGILHIDGWSENVLYYIQQYYHKYSMSCLK